MRTLLGYVRLHITKLVESGRKKNVSKVRVIFVLVGFSVLVMYLEQKRVLQV